ncbi:hypothetical protein B0T10DRAFT_466331 [Thelonectria olida]|uniref:Uncharacterized protein n=1 Tax=Thelonectria olida TaxID=1576542 RepID=A0A9P9AJ65_9HYPO|nr:hypothetical protein B0T10DRAFT_466331 [Thelonectria olida]
MRTQSTLAEAIDNLIEVASATVLQVQQIKILIDGTDTVNSGAFRKFACSAEESTGLQMQPTPLAMRRNDQLSRMSTRSEVSRKLISSRYRRRLCRNLPHKHAAQCRAREEKTTKLDQILGSSVERLP